MLRFAQRILGKAGQVLFLELMFERDPVLPGGIKRFAEHVAELGCVERLAVLAAAEPLDGPLNPVSQCQIGEEAGAVLIGIRADLEIGLRAFAFQPERRVNARLSCTLARNTISS